MFNLEASGLIGLISAFIVEALKKAPQVPLVAGQTARIRKVAAAFAFLGNLGYAVADGNVDAVNLVAQTVTSFLVSYLTYKGVIADPNKGTPVTQ